MRVFVSCRARRRSRSGVRYIGGPVVSVRCLSPLSLVWSCLHSCTRKFWTVFKPDFKLGRSRHEKSDDFLGRVALWRLPAILDFVAQLFVKHKESPPISHNLPPVAGALTWSRGLLERVSLPMAKITGFNQKASYWKTSRLLLSTLWFCGGLLFGVPIKEPVPTSNSTPSSFLIQTREKTQSEKKEVHRTCRLRVLLLAQTNRPSCGSRGNHSDWINAVSVDILNKYCIKTEYTLNKCCTQR